MKISEFVIGRDVEKQAVYRYINRHEELLSKCSKEGKELEMPMEVVKELEKQYPLQKPITIINGLEPEKERELREELADALKKLTWSENQRAGLEKILGEQKGLIESNEAKMLALETQKDAEISVLEIKNEHLQYRMQEQEQEQARTKTELLEQEKENRKLREEIERLRNRSLFDRIFNK